MSTRPSLTRIMNDCRTRLPGALDSAIQNELFNVLHELFQDSNVWQQDIPFNVVPNVSKYQIAPEGTGQIDRLMWVVNSSNILVGASYPGMDQVQLYVTPSQSEVFTATVALTVVDPTTEDGFPQCPDWIFDKYSTGILDGVLGRMMSQPAKPYANTQLAIMHMGRFRNAISRARREAMHQNLYGAQSWQFPRGFAGRRK